MNDWLVFYRKFESSSSSIFELLSFVWGVSKSFRSPGYARSEDIEDTLFRLGYLYDGSKLPGFGLMLIKIKCLFSTYKKSFPYIVSNFYSRRIIKKKIYNIPIYTMKFLRIPAHSTFAFFFGQIYLRFCFLFLKFDKTYKVFLFHAIDLLDDRNKNFFELNVKGRKKIISQYFAQARSCITTESYINLKI